MPRIRNSVAIAPRSTVSSRSGSGASSARDLEGDPAGRLADGPARRRERNTDRPLPRSRFRSDRASPRSSGRQSPTRGRPHAIHRGRGASRRTWPPGAATREGPRTWRSRRGCRVGHKLEPAPARRHFVNRDRNAPRPIRAARVHSWLLVMLPRARDCFGIGKSSSARPKRLGVLIGELPAAART